MKHKKSKIEGMTCSACASRIERVVGKIDGVETASVNFAAEMLNVTYDENKVDEAKITAVVEKAGFKLKKQTKAYTFKIEGMTCSACASRIERIVRKIAGIEEASVNFASEKLNVTVAGPRSGSQQPDSTALVLQLCAA